MRTLLTKNPSLQQLCKDIKFYSDKIKDNLKSSKTSSTSSVQKIKRKWQQGTIKETIVKSPYFAYLSLVDPAEEQRQLSAIMFGRHVAELRQNAREQIDNPLINMQESYHRSVDLANEVNNAFYKELGIPDFNGYTYIPITLLKNNPIGELLGKFNQITNLHLYSKEPYSIAVLVIPKNTPSTPNHLREQVYLLKEKVRNLGLVASSWEIAENLRHSKINNKTIQTDIKLDDDLPKTKSELVQSDIFSRLNRIANGSKYPTRRLAQCIERMLKNSPELSPQAIQRIALMLDLSNTFYRHNYPRYAFCVYAILHEISLALLKDINPLQLEQEFKNFQEESSATFLEITGLEKEKMEQSTFIASSSTSGVSACAVAMRVASKMNTADGKAPKVKIFTPCYYELPNISNLNATNSTREADIFMISAGPIVNPEGLTPGVDINLFVRRNIINAKRTKPTTIVVDATTALYTNFKLDEDVKKLIEEGSLSIIVFESHQKFGLIHSDQAQYGRVFGYCSKKHIPETELKIIEENSKDDFDKHIDIRIGSFVSTRCQEILEDIKKQHFTNGTILRNILIQTSLISKGIVSHEDMSKNLNELYFLNDDLYTHPLEKAAYGVIDYRASFGHYSPTTMGVAYQRRFSPDASDDVDCLVQACHIRLSQDHTVQKMLDYIIEAGRAEENVSLEEEEEDKKNASEEQKKNTSLDEQIIITGMLHKIISNKVLIPTNFQEMRYLTRLPTQEELSEHKTKSRILLIDMPGKRLRLGYFSHDNLFKQIEIQDVEKSALLRTLKDNTPENLAKVKNVIYSLQTKAMPKNANFTLMFAAISNAFEYCPLLKKRQYGTKINQWITMAGESILLHYAPQEPNDFLDAMRNLYKLKIPLKEDQLMILSQNPDLCLSIKNNTDPQLTKSTLILHTILGNSEDFSQVLRKPNFITAILKVYDTNEDILSGLETAPEKLQEARTQAKKYTQMCFRALLDFYKLDKTGTADRDNLLTSFKQAQSQYTEVLSKDRSTASKTARYLIKALTNFIAALTLGLAHYVHYKKTGTAAFFSGTNSESKLKKASSELNQDLENIPLDNNPSTRN